MVRLGQRTELEAYFRQFLADLRPLSERDIETAKSRYLSLVVTLVVSTLEIGAPGDTERLIAGTAREVSAIEDPETLLRSAESLLAHMTVCARPNANRYAIQIVERAKQMVSQRHREPLTDDEVATIVHLSRSHFRYLFKEVTGVPFKRYLMEVRLCAARKLLEETQLSVKEICREVGCTDPSSFYRAYRAYHGVPPTAHRRASA